MRERRPREFDIRALFVERIEIDRDDNHIVACLGRFFEEQNVIVVRREERDVQMRVQRRIRAANAVERRDFADDVARPVPVPRAQLILLGVEIFLAVRQCGCFAEFETAIHAPQSRQRCRQRRADHKTRAARRLQMTRIDIGRIDEEIRPVMFARVALRKLGQILGEIALRFAPREIRVRLREADLREPVHHARPRERFRQEDRLRMPRAYVGDHPFPERQRFRMRIVDAENAHARLDPEQDHVAQGEPQIGFRIVRVEIRVHDVLIFLRRIFGVAQRAVGAPGEPGRMLFQPRVIGRALNREVECDLEAVFMRGGEHLPEVVERAEFGMHGRVAAFLAASRVRAADVARLRVQRVVAALAVRHADRVDRRKVQHVEAHVADARQFRGDVGEGAVAVHVVAHRAREELVPACEARGGALGFDPVDHGVSRQEGTMARGGHRARCRRREQQFLAAGGVGFREFLDDMRERLRDRAFGRFHFREHEREQMARFLDFQLDSLVGLQLFLHVLDERRKIVAPRDHRELVAAEPFERNPCGPQIVAGRWRGMHGRFLPGGFVGGAPEDRGGDPVVTFGEDRRFHFDAFACDALDRELPAVDRRRHAFDRDARGGDRVQHGFAAAALAVGFVDGRREHDGLVRRRGKQTARARLQRERR